MPKAEDRGERAILPSLFGKDKTENWEKRRKELGEILAGEEYGKIPPPLPFRAEILKTQEEFAGKGFMEWLSLHFEREEAAFSFPARLIYPKGGRKFPFFIFANFSDAVPDRYFPAEEIIDHGFGVLSFCYQDVSADLDSFGQGAEKLFFSGDRAPSDFGKISLWAWAMSRLLDYLLQRGLADENRIAAIGHSRLGKTALWAGANDERFSFVFSNNSGCSGAALSRNKSGETVKIITDAFPHWFCKNYRKYADHEASMPFDQHFLLAMIAPRTVAIGAAKEDTWADSRSQYLSCRAAESAYRLFRPGTSFEDDSPRTGKEYGTSGIFFREREGTHYLSRADWLYYLRIMEKSAPAKSENF